MNWHFEGENKVMGNTEKVMCEESLVRGEDEIEMCENDNVQD